MSAPTEQSAAGESRSELREHPIVFYDGECALCNGFVQWLIARDRRRMFRFAPLQGKTAAERIGPQDGEPEQWTVILLDEFGKHERSEAALRIMRHLGGIWSIAVIFRILPRFIRDRVYRFIARHRFRWFGQATSCRMPNDAERVRFLP